MNNKTQYQKEWRHSHPENIRKNKKTSYWNNPEKHRKKSRDTYDKKHNIQPSKKLSDMLKHKMPPKTRFKLFYIKDYAREIFENKLAVRHDDIAAIFELVRKDVKSFENVLSIMKKNLGSENVTLQLQKELAARYENLTYPWNDR